MHGDILRPFKIWTRLCFILLLNLGIISSDVKRAQQMESVLLFENVQDKEINLYINGKKSVTSIVTWTIKNTTITAHWKENYPNIFMDSNRNIRICNVDEGYEGKYFIQHSPYPEVELYIQDALSVSIDNGERLSTPVGRSTTITCSVSGSGTLSVVWFGPINNTLTNTTKYTLTLYNISTGKSNLTIFAGSTTDSGLYICQATNGFGSVAQDAITLTVYVPLTVCIDHGEMLSRPLGSNATITCSVSGSGTISVIWIGPHGNALTSNTKYTVTSYNINTRKSAVTISVLSITESGLYTCLATDGSGSTVQDSITLTAYDPLSVSIDNGFSLSSPIGTVVTITCSVCGFGTNSIVWIGPIGITLTSSIKYTVTSYNTNSGKSTLTIFALSTTDSGLYICQATDRFGSTAQDYLTLIVYVPLSVSIDNGSSVTGVSGGSITITCSVSGTGTITVTWVNPLGNNISSGPKYTMSSYYYNTGKNTLTIQSQSMSDVGTYTCRASDSKTQLEDSIYVTTAVLSAVIKETILFANVGDNKVINCSVIGSYQSINWYLGNTLLSGGQKYQISQSTSGGSTLSSLTIFSVQYSDAILYVCQAVSSIDGVTAASDSVALSFGDNSHHLKSDSLESDSLESHSGMTTDYIIIAVLSAILTIIIFIIIVYNIKLQEEVCFKCIYKRLDVDLVHNKDFGNNNRKGWITGKHWIQKRCCCQNMKPEQLPQPHEMTRATIEELGKYCPLLEGDHNEDFAVNITLPELQEEVCHEDIKKGLDDNPVHNMDFELTEDQVQYWLDGHPDFVKKYLELTEDRVQYWLDGHPDFIKKYLELQEEAHHEDIKKSLDDNPVHKKDFDQYETCPGIQPTFDELNVKLKDEWTPREDNLQQIVSSHASSDQHVIYYPGNLPTLDELGVTLTDTWTPRENIQLQRMPSHSSLETDPLLGPRDPTTFQSSGIGCEEGSLVKVTLLLDPSESDI